MSTHLESLYLTAQSANRFIVRGKVQRKIGLIFEADLPNVSIGSLIQFINSRTRHSIGLGEVIGFSGDRAMIMALDLVDQVSTETLVEVFREQATVRVGPSLLGRVIDGRGMPIDGKGPLFSVSDSSSERNVYRTPIEALERAIIKDPLDLGVRSINSMITCGKGQRLGIMAGSGVGKSVLLGMMAKNTSSDVNVIALIGERGREVREFLENDLGKEGLARSVVVVATSDQSPLLRMRAAYLATSIAEYFRDKSKDVLLLMDSVTRFCMAGREVGLSLGEPPASKGYTPSVFSALPKLLERAGTGKDGGSITGLYTVLVEGDDLDDPIADSARSILDGHIVLSRKLAERAHYPAIDVLQSISRVMPMVITSEHQKWAEQIRTWLANYAEVEDLIHIGAYVKGTNPKIDLAVLMHDRIMDFLKQQKDLATTFEQTVSQMHAIILAAQAHSAPKKASETNEKSLRF